MRVNRAGAALQALLQAILALALAAGASALLLRAGSMAMLTALLVLLTLFFFAALTLLRGLLSIRRFQLGGRGGRGPRGPGPGGWPGGVREPRRTFPPRMPPRAAAAEPDTAGS